MPRPHRFRDICTRIIEMLDKQIAEIQPIVAQPLGSKEQRLARIELALLEISREKAVKGLKRAIEGLKPTK
jgi:hypothetical protein